MYPKKELAQLVISACHQFNIDTVIISPGSRNAPLTIGFSNHPEIETLSVVDERCAAFFALGIAQQKRKPVAMICSSGSALLNYYPAIAEAFYSNIPLVVISADRPKHLIDIGDGQTIRQENVFENHVLFSANLTESTNKSGNQFIQNKTLVSKALQIAISKKAPVHINVPFDEPLYETVDELKKVDFSENLDENYKNQENLDENYEKLLEIWNTSSKKMILVGSHFPEDELQAVLSDLADNQSVLVFTETTSNLDHLKFINSIDKLIIPLNEADFSALRPAVLITLGGMVISKKIKQFLRKYTPKHHWHIDEFKAMDTYQCLSEFVQEKPVHFLRKLVNQQENYQGNKVSELAEVSNFYQQKWLVKKQERNQKHQQYLANCEYSDLKVFETILKAIPSNSQLQISNSSIIRYSQLFDTNKTLQIFCNRGTSGIDGSTSTAIGAGFATKTIKRTTFITGDLSFFYDSNALWNTNIPSDFRIIIINNAGGGIFRFIPGPSTTNATSYFETPHNLTAEHLAKMYDFEYTAISNLEELTAGLPDFYTKSVQPKIMEIFTPKEINDVVLKNYFKNL
ncbi:2-succinyl-5-enolpyruvyl-6-hydroxy-3-cyclohexene-1-carboxylic-acid synthase [Tenacibaculum finnmarkense]|uniref:2-succinyl-5-enolpyruvyl-6-hydroxy-3- cyclohexene-1-carboxylic-acid synthase n=1 Tax=Tenacibaculum finnmarkense TaxID=2781243 RepID=UPI00187B72E7|nr:2-succinyl-5-enolpyruvyl-6-hydroxy-3-cyclohexene-1-carboxylic-acid synthase [Tenacibaculum finnmarkense]MBE7634505.1 2-succinyl-5-enolpyruvyl-6-hydroxy-3-cyclohexene-1-carboxylic-acid synthase [Tenacibaculum finnmarkense genomovar ulcerans]MCD8410472.1 2-succinyl-5-enolpyruvyl-6-hydroxy-3-cyclohexene-1-carboxylic-acid synthase [Tenacibaculum finnmarkense genomovar ulcerans]MCD8430306.1 2-succinyl-5-enolpyruvyl-6-hydroxy-3-cyclohexene-1-carboxylic-acid synthase [Tenacibaculum finnmarkense geno